MQDFVWWSAGLRVSLFTLGGEVFFTYEIQQKKALRMQEYLWV